MDFNSKQIIYSKVLCMQAFVFLMISESAYIWAHQDDQPEIDIKDFVTDADFVFKGTVIDVSYRDAKYLDDTTGLPLNAEGAGLPYCFVTYHIDTVHKGVAPVDPATGGVKDEVTLRFLGGPSGRDPNRILYLPVYPLFDPGDQDFLFVIGNTSSNCPLTRGANGRFRILTRTGDPNPMIYSEMGHEVHQVTLGELLADDLAVWGPAHPDIPEVMNHMIGGELLERINVDDDTTEFAINVGEPGEEHVPEAENPPGTHFSELRFEAYLAAVVTSVCIPPVNCSIQVVSADITQPFEAPSAPDELPPDIRRDEVAEIAEVERPWLDALDPNALAEILENKRLEELALELTNGDPVLPANPCEELIITQGALPGDISGPMGKPDCFVNLWDFQALTAAWLECNDPENPTCIQNEVQVEP